MKKINQNNPNQLIINRFKKRYFLYLTQTTITPEGLSSEEREPIVIGLHQRLKINDHSAILISGDMGTGLGDPAARFLYFSGQGQGNDRRYRLKNHPQLKNFFVITEMEKQDWVALSDFTITDSKKVQI